MKRRPPSDETTDLLRLIRTEGVGPVTYRRLLDRYKTAAAALNALPHLARAGGRTNTPAIPSPDEVEREIAQTVKLGGTYLFLGRP